MTRCWLLPCIAALALLFSACSQNRSASDEELTHLFRRGQFGSLRDFVIYHRVQDPAGTALLVDRFEVTQDDWAEFAKTEAGVAVAARTVGSRGSGALPASGMDLSQARAFARWRLGRLPTAAEWRRATVGGGSSPFPWGVKEFATHANSGNLALHEPTPVGTFESGRRAAGNAPYDLIGNVREWTETVPSEWCGDDSIGSSYTASRLRLLSTPALSVWSIKLLAPPAMIAAAGGADVPRRVVGVDFATPLGDILAPADDTQFPDERRPRTGMRVYTTVDELLNRLLGMKTRASAEQRLQLVRFVARKDHRKVLTAAFLESPFADRSFSAGSVAEVLSTALRTQPVAPK